jgi:phage terminase large subunit-like protein
MRPHRGVSQLWTATRSTERIDGIVALIMAIGRAMVAQDEPQPEYSMFFV